MVPGMTYRDCQAIELRRQDLLTEVARARLTADRLPDVPRAPRLAASRRALAAVVAACSSWLAARRLARAAGPAD
jgi:hypothetical protein